MELPGVEYTPAGVISQAWIPGRSVTFTWRLQARLPGEYSGTVWLHGREAPSGAGSQARWVVSAQSIRLRAASFLGVDSFWVQALGITGAVVGAVFGLDGVIVWFWRRSVIQ